MTHEKWLAETDDYAARAAGDAATLFVAKTGAAIVNAVASMAIVPIMTRYLIGLDQT